MTDTTNYASVRLPGHGFRKVKGGLSSYRGFIPTCECGHVQLNWSTTLKHAKQLHGEHKKRVLKGTE